MRAIYRSDVGLLLLASAALAGCGHNDVYLRPEHASFLSLSSEKDGSSVLRVGADEVKVKCFDWRGNLAKQSWVPDPRPRTEDTQCLYLSADVKDVATNFAPAAVAANAAGTKNGELKKTSGELIRAATVDEKSAPKDESAAATAEPKDQARQRNIYYSF